MTTELLQTEERLTAVIHLTVARADIVHVMGPAVSEVLTALKAQGLSPAGPLFSHHGRRPTDTFDFEVGFPITSPLIAVGRVRLSTLPALRVARTRYQGAYEGLPMAWGEFGESLAKAGLQTQESLWECYLVGPESSPDPAQRVTELNRPLAE